MISARVLKDADILDMHYETGWVAHFSAEEWDSLSDDEKSNLEIVMSPGNGAQGAESGG